MKIRVLALIFGFIFLFSIFHSCIKDPVDQPGNNNNNTVEDFTNLQVTPVFKFSTASEASFHIEAYDLYDNPIEGAKFFIYKGQPDSGGVLMLSGLSNSLGIFESGIVLPIDLDNVYIRSEFIGLPSEIKASVINNQIVAVFGGSNFYRSNHYREGNGVQNAQITNHALKYLGTFKTDGTPNYLESPGDKISSSLLSDINKSLPERYNVPTYHPNYLASTNETNILIKQKADVWLTFVHEGAGYLNTLCFYTYTSGSAPSKISDIDTLIVAFPNVSYKNSGGGLKSGDKIKLGRFDKNTVIGFALIANGYKNGKITDGYHIIYTNTNLNPESKTSLQIHNVMLNDPGRNTVLMGFEDMKRDNSACDNDFNDAIFFVTSNPVVAVETSTMPQITYTEDDRDNDGVPDNYDDYPYDKTKAFNNYYPDNDGFGSLAFEDLWPGQGDYDFNDLVVDYRFNQITNGDNKVVEIEGTLVTRAIGASNRNGFGFELGIASSAISSVSGYQLFNNLIKLNANGTEANQNNSVIIAFDDARKLFPPSSGYINTESNAPALDPDTIKLVIKLSSPQKSADLGYPPYNPFIFIDQTRGRELHLPDNQPTSLAVSSYFQTAQDASNPAKDFYYRTENNLPWALHLVKKFEYPTEKTSILKAYSKFADWAQSNGSLYSSWYSSPYQDQKYIYK